MTWKLLSGAADSGRPPARFYHGFTSAGGKLYVHGGRYFGGTGSILGPCCEVPGDVDGLLIATDITRGQNQEGASLMYRARHCQRAST